MITLTFSEFSNPDNFPDDDAIELYVLRDKEKILYIGISKSNVWNRWFGNLGRMWTTSSGKWNTKDQVGLHIIENFPQSNEWEIDLLTLQDCLNFLEVEYVIGEYGFLFRPNSVFYFDIKDVEPKMIGKLHPFLNRIYNGGKEDIEFVNKYYNFIKEVELQ